MDWSAEKVVGFVVVVVVVVNVVVNVVVVAVVLVVVVVVLVVACLVTWKLVEGDWSGLIVVVNSLLVPGPPLALSCSSCKAIQV